MSSSTGSLNKVCHLTKANLPACSIPCAGSVSSWSQQLEEFLEIGRHLASGFYAWKRNMRKGQSQKKSNFKKIKSCGCQFVRERKGERIRHTQNLSLNQFSRWHIQSSFIFCWTEQIFFFFRKLHMRTTARILVVQHDQICLFTDFIWGVGEELSLCYNFPLL